MTWVILLYLLITPIFRDTIFFTMQFKVVSNRLPLFSFCGTLSPVTSRKGFLTGKWFSRHFPGTVLPDWSNPTPMGIESWYCAGCCCPQECFISVIRLTEVSRLPLLRSSWGPRRGCPSRLVQPSLESLYIKQIYSAWAEYWANRQSHTPAVVFTRHFMIPSFKRSVISWSNPSFTLVYKAPLSHQ